MRITPADAGWEHLHFAVRRLAPSERWIQATGPHEYGLVVLGGICSVDSSRGKWEALGRRPDVFHGMPYALYLPRDTKFTLTSIGTGCKVAYGWCLSRGVCFPSAPAGDGRLHSPRAAAWGGCVRPGNA